MTRILILTASSKKRISVIVGTKGAKSKHVRRDG